MATPVEGSSGSSPWRRRIGWVLAFVVVLAVGGLYIALVAAGIFGNGGKQLTTLSPHGSEAQKIQDLITPVFAVAGIVFVLVFGAVLSFCLKYRDRGDDAEDFPVQRHGSTPLEIGWTVLPALILLVVAVFTVATIVSLNRIPKNALKVEVSGQQWWWAFHYDMNNDGNYTDTAHGDIITATELIIPIHREVDLTITSQDVIHSFWIPALNGKKDAVPGQHHPLILQANKLGVYRGQCTQFCGLSHANMRMLVRVVSEKDFDRWVRNQQQTAVKPTSDVAMAGQKIFEQQLCSSCHLIRGVNDAKIAKKWGGKAPGGGTAAEQQVSGVAPDLTHIASRGTFAGSIYNLYTPDSLTDPGHPGDAADVANPGDPGNALYGDDSAPFTWNVTGLSAWLRNPPLMKPMYAGPNVPADKRRGMPNLHLTELQISELVAYLETLR
jgi:cytochrome c oxidase subunit 2